MNIQENLCDVNMDEVLDFLMDDYYWHMPTDDIQPHNLQIQIPTETKANYLNSVIDYKINHCKVKRIQNYYLVKCPYCDAKQYQECHKPIFENELITCSSMKCKKIFYH
jgi:hypothetical protein